MLVINCMPSAANMDSWDLEFISWIFMNVPSCMLLVSTCAPMGKSMTHYYFDSSRITRCWTFAGVRLMHHPRRIEEAVFTSQEYGIFLHIPSRTKGILQAISVHRVWKQKSLLSARKSWTVCIQLQPEAAAPCGACYSLAAGIIDGPAARSPVRPKGTGGGPTTGTVKNRIRLSVILLIILL